MKMMSIHIDETLADREINKLKRTLAAIPHVVNVELNVSVPHDLMVECEEHYNMPVIILEKLFQEGLHSDVQSC